MTQQDALSAALSAPPPPPPPSSAAGSSNSGSSGGGSSRRGSGAAAAATTTTTGPGSVKDYIKIINEISNRNGLGEGEGGGSGVVAGGGGSATAGTVRRGLSKRNVNVPTTAPSGVAPAASSVAAAKAKLALSTTNTTGSCSSTESESSSSLSAAATSGGGGGGSGTGGTGRMANKLRMSLNDISNRGGGHPNLPSTPSKKGGAAASASDRSTGAAGTRSTPSTPSSVERARKTSERIRKLYGSTAERTGPTNSTPSKSAVAATAPSPPTGAGGGPDLNRSFEMPPRKKKNDLLSPLTLRRRNSSTPRDHEELDGLVQDAGRMHRRSASGGALDGVPRQQRPPEWGEVEVGGESPNKPAKDRLRDQIDRSRRLQSALKDVQTAHRHELRQLQSLPDSAADGPPPTSAAAQSSSAGKYSGQIRQRLRKTVGAASQVKQLKRAVKGGAGGGAGGGSRKTSPEPRDIVVSKCESAVVVSAESQLLQQRHRREIMARSQSMSSVVGTARTTTPTTTTTRSATSSRIAPPGASPDEDGDLPSLAAGDLPPLSSRHRRHSSEPPPPPPDAAPPTPPSTGKGAAAAPGRPIKARATTVTVTQQSSSSSTATHVSLLRQGQGREEYAAMTSEARLTRQIRATHRGEHPGHRINARTYNTVKVHVYDLIHSETWVDTPWGCEFPLGKCFSTCNDTLHFMGTGAYHAGIEVNGVEYAYGSSDVRGVSGVFTCFPKASPGYEYRTTLDFGKLKTVNRRWMRVPVSPDGGGGGAGGSAFRSAMDGGGRSSDDGVMSDVGVGGGDRSNPYPRTPAAQRPPSSSSVVTPEEREEGGEYGGGKITYASEYREVETFLDGLDIMRKMSMEYMGVDYDLFRKNCCTFVKDACIRLGVKEEEIPTWFLNLADAGVSTEETLVAVDANVCAPIKNMIEVQADEQERIANEPFEASSSSRLSQEPKKCNTETLFTPEGFEVIAEEIEGNYGRRTEMEIVRVEESQEHAFDIHGGGGASSRKTAGEQEDSLLIGLRETLSWTY